MTKRTVVKHLNDQEVLQRSLRLAEVTEKIEALQKLMKEEAGSRKAEIDELKREQKALARVVRTREEETEEEAQMAIPFGGIQ